MHKRREVSFTPIENADLNKRYFRIYSDGYSVGDVFVVASQLTRPHFDADLLHWCELHFKELTPVVVREANLDKVKL